MSRKTRYCYKCGNQLMPGDPARTIIKKDGEPVEHFVGICYACNSDEIIINRWKKRGLAAVDDQIKKIMHNLSLLAKAQFVLRQKEKAKDGDQGSSGDSHPIG
jgi:hypothetical protein